MFVIKSKNFRCFLLVLVTFAAVSQVCFARQTIMPVFGGLSMATRVGRTPRAGFDLALLYGSRSDAAGGVGIVAGSSRFSDDEYYIGPAAGVFYMGSMWIEAVAHIRRSRYDGFRLTGAFGFFVMPFISVGYTKDPARPLGEIGIMLKVPVYIPELD